MQASMVSSSVTAAPGQPVKSTMVAANTVDGKTQQTVVQNGKIAYQGPGPQPQFAPMPWFGPMPMDGKRKLLNWWNRGGGWNGGGYGGGWSGSQAQAQAQAQGQSWGGLSQSQAQAQAQSQSLSNGYGSGRADFEMNTDSLGFEVSCRCCESSIGSWLLCSPTAWHVW